MRKTTYILTIAIASCWMNFSTLSAQNKAIPFGVGEQITYKIHYGFVNAAEAVMKIKPQYEKVNGKDCYRVVIEGRTTGMFDLFMRVRDEFGTYIDKDLIAPRKFYRKIEEGKYRKHEIVNFDIEHKKATVNKYDDKKKKWKGSEEFDTYQYAQDLVSAYYYLRTLNFDQYTKGDTIDIKIFFDDENTNFRLLYRGRETVRTKLGKYRSIVISPIMPENKLFDGQDAIRVWLSDDKDKIPLKVKAKMFIGAIEIDIKKYKRGVK